MKVLLILLFNLIACLNGELYEAIEELTKLAINEENLIKHWEWLEVEMETNLEYLRKKIINIKKEHHLMGSDFMDYVSNPLNAFLLVKRTTLDSNLINQQSLTTSSEFLNKVSNLTSSQSELTGTVIGLARLQETYGLKSEDLANGIIDGVKYRDELTSHDLYDLGNELLNADKDYLAIEYLNLALQRLEEVPEKYIEMMTLSRLSVAYNRTNEYEEAILKINELLKLDPLNKIRHEDRELFQKLLFKQLEEEDDEEYYELQNKELNLYRRVCSGIERQDAKEISRLHCRFVSNSFFSKLARFKIEEASLDPYIVVFIDVVSDNEIEELKQISKLTLSSAKIDQDEFADVAKRLAKVAWYEDEDNEIVARLSRRVEDMTGLTTSTAESLQIQNYGIGGHYQPHFDFILSYEKQLIDESFDYGNRVATVLFYLSDVEKGGATVFPSLKIKIPARKGTAAFWFNLQNSGDGEYLTRHAACPVLVGSKWVANKWLHEQGQEFLRPCDLKYKSVNENYESYLKRNGEEDIISYFLNQHIQHQDK
ncbi:unnamed protein product [Diamesa hyperborea]